MRLLWQLLLPFRRQQRAPLRAQPGGLAESTHKVNLPSGSPRFTPGDRGPTPGGSLVWDRFNRRAASSVLSPVSDPRVMCSVVVSRVLSFASRPVVVVATLHFRLPRRGRCSRGEVDLGRDLQRPASRQRAAVESVIVADEQ